MHAQLEDMALWRRQSYIDGQWRDARSGKTLDVVNPASRQVLGTIAVFS